MKRHEAWRAAYRLDRYLRRATLETIAKRSQDIAANMMFVDSFGRLTPGPATDASAAWWELFTHILEELALRNEPYGSVELMRNDQFPWISAPEPPRGLRILRGRSLPTTPYLSRVGQREHIKASYEKGLFRISPASSYADPSLNPAIRDEDELAVTLVSPGDNAIVRPFDPRTGREGDPIPIIGELRHARSTPDNFYVLCCSERYDLRHLDDFNADALLIIENIPRFLTRIGKAVHAKNPYLQFLSCAVQYYDPYRHRDTKLAPQISKNFRYQYQQEYRLLWFMRDLGLDIQPFFVEIGSLQDIARIYLMPR